MYNFFLINKINKLKRSEYYLGEDTRWWWDWIRFHSKLLRMMRKRNVGLLGPFSQAISFIGPQFAGPYVFVRLVGS